MTSQTITQHVVDIIKAAAAVILVQVLIVLLKDLQVLIPGWLNFLGSTSAGTVAIKMQFTRLVS